jgi:hypothetical protein
MPSNSIRTASLLESHTILRPKYHNNINYFIDDVHYKMFITVHLFKYICLIFLQYLKNNKSKYSNGLKSEILKPTLI